jgi:hypothetical protein
MPPERLNGPFCGVGAFLVWGDELVGDALVVKVGKKGCGGFVV